MAQEIYELISHFFIALNKRDEEYFTSTYRALFEFCGDRQTEEIFNVIKDQLTPSELNWIKAIV